MSGPLLVRRGARCGARSMHPGPREGRPPAAYLFTASPCHVDGCRGTLFCVGHPVCVDCGAGLRSGSLVWDQPGAEGDDVDLQVITSRGLT